MISQLERISLHCHSESPAPSWVEKILWRRDRLPTAVLLGFPSGSAGKESAGTAGDMSLIPGLQ